MDNLLWSLLGTGATLTAVIVGIANAYAQSWGHDDRLNVKSAIVGVIAVAIAMYSFWQVAT